MTNATQETLSVQQTEHPHIVHVADISVAGRPSGDTVEEILQAHPLSGY
jgi:hypothetical protein